MGERGQGASRRLRAAAAFVALAVGVVLAGAFLLPQLRVDASVRPTEARPAVAEPRQPVDDTSCGGRHERRRHA